MSTTNNDYSTFGTSQNKGVTKGGKSERSNSPDSSSEIQSTSLVLVQEQSIEPSQNGNHQPPKTRYIS